MRLILYLGDVQWPTEMTQSNGMESTENGLLSTMYTKSFASRSTGGSVCALRDCRMCN